MIRAIETCGNLCWQKTVAFFQNLEKIEPINGGKWLQALFALFRKIGGKGG